VRIAIPVLTAGIFFLDWLTPVAVVDWVLYFIPLLLSFYTSARFSPVLLAVVFSILTGLGFFLSPSGLEPGVALLNLLLGLGTLWVVAFLVARLRRSERFLQSTLDAISAHIVILDENGTMLAVNAAWSRLARENDFKGDRHGLGDNYLKICESATGSGSEQAPAMAEGIRSVIAGQTGEFHLEYPCHSPQEQRWFAVCVTRFSSDGPVRVVVAHENITERKRAEANLRNSEQRMRLQTAALESCANGVTITDLRGTIQWVNEAVTRLTGYSAAEVIGQNPRLFKSGRQSESFYKEMWLTISQGRVWSGEIVNRHKTHQLYHEEMTITPVRGEGGKITHFIAIKRDITERKRAEEVLKEQLALRDRLAKIAANVPGLIYSFRLRPDGAVSLPYASPTIEEFVGMRAEDLAADASSLLNQIHPEDRSDVDESIAESARTLLPWRAEFRVRHPKKGLFWVEGQSTPEREADGGILWHGFMSDISERKQAEKTLREKEHMLSESQRLGHVGSWFGDLTGLLSWSEETYRIYGVSPDTFFPTVESLLGLVHPDDRPAVLDWQNRLAVGQKLGELEFRIKGPDGSIRFIKRNGEAVYDADNRFIHMAGMVQDITERKKAQADRETLEGWVAEHRRREQNARLALVQQQKQFQIQSRFVSMVSHEFRTPLSIINMAAELLDGYLDKMSDAERSEHLHEIKSSVERLTQMMNDFLIHSNCANGKIECKPARVDVEALCRKIIFEVPACSDPVCAIECVVDPAVGEAWLDERIMGHILGNLLSNAVKYSVDGQPVKLEVKWVAGSPQLNDGPDPLSETHLEFKVSDSGIGIPAGDLAKICQAFHRSANVGNRPGTGMGMTIVKQFLDLLGGKIRFKSEEGKGTTVWVELPTPAPAQPAEI
jgi:hypothetical protein